MLLLFSANFEHNFTPFFSVSFVDFEIVLFAGLRLMKILSEMDESCKEIFRIRMGV